MSRDGDSEESEGSKRQVVVDDLSLSNVANVTEVGTTTPVEDFGKLLLHGFDLSIGKHLIFISFDKRNIDESMKELFGTKGSRPLSIEGFFTKGQIYVKQEPLSFY